MDQKSLVGAVDGAIAIFVKTPGLSPVKTRLAAGIGQEQAEQFYQLSIKAIESAVAGCVGQWPLMTPYWAVAEKEALGNPLWGSFQKLWQGEGELGDRLFNIYDAILKKHRFAILVGADSPQLPVRLLVRTVELLNRPGFVLGQALDGGFYLFGGKTPVSLESWRGVPYSKSDTASLLREKVAQLDLISDLPRLTDVDTIQDFKALDADFENGAGLTPEQVAVWDWIRRKL